MKEHSSKYRPIIDRQHFKRGVEYIQTRVDEAPTTEERLRAYLLYGQLVGVHALVGFSALIDRILLRSLPPSDNGPKQ